MRLFKLRYTREGEDIVSTVTMFCASVSASERDPRRFEHAVAVRVCAHPGGEDADGRPLRARRRADRQPATGLAAAIPSLGDHVHVAFATFEKGRLTYRML